MPSNSSSTATLARPLADQENITAMLDEWQKGDREALDRALPVIYETLRRKAFYYIDGENNCITLQPTALVNEVFVRLAESRELRFENRTQFFAFAGRLMRHILRSRAQSSIAKTRQWRTQPSLARGIRSSRQSLA